MTKDELAILTEYLVASDGMHKVYGSTAVCYGGVGGQAMTPHCAHVCHNVTAHETDQQRYDNAYHAARVLLESQRGAHG